MAGIKIKQDSDWRTLEFFVPINESLEEDGSFIIKGVAINETTTLNNVKYVSEELEKAAPSFRNVPILLDHKNEVKNIVGRTTENVKWNALSRRIEFEGKIMDKGIQEMIKDGRIGSVSIGAKVHDLIEEEDGSMKALGIMGLELSLVAVPGDTHANLAQALEKSFVLKEKAELNTTAEDKIKTEDTNMEEKQEETETPTEEAPVEAPAEEAPKEAEEKVVEKVAQEINVKVDTSEVSDMKAQLAEIKALVMKNKSVQEVEAEVEAEDETKGEVTEEPKEEAVSVGVVVESCGAGKLSLYRDYSKESSNLKRLAR